MDAPPPGPGIIRGVRPSPDGKTRWQTFRPAPSRCSSPTSRAARGSGKRTPRRCAPRSRATMRCCATASPITTVTSSRRVATPSARRSTRRPMRLPRRSRRSGRCIANLGPKGRSSACAWRFTRAQSRCVTATMNVLAKIRGLRVASRTSAFSFKGKDVDIPTVAQKLNVATVLEGSVRKSGKRVRITAQLIEVSSDSHLWSDTYDRELDDIFAVQDDIAQSVVKELRSALMGETAAPAAITSAAADVPHGSTGRAENPEAFRLYLQGKFFGERTTQADTDKAIELYRQALAIDPSFALAWAGLSRMHHAQAGHGFAPIAEGFERAREAAQHAVRLAPDLAEGYIELGQVQELYDWDWSAADASERRALELAPGSAKAVMAAASLARILGRFDVGLELMRKAVALDPLSPRTHRQA